MAIFFIFFLVYFLLIKFTKFLFSLIISDWNMLILMGLSILYNIKEDILKAQQPEDIIELFQQLKDDSLPISTSDLFFGMYKFNVNNEQIIKLD